MSQESSNPSINLSKLAGTAIAVGAGNSGADTLRVVVATNQLALPVSQSGTWTVGLSAAQTLATVTTVSTVTAVTSITNPIALAADDVHDGVAGTTGNMVVGYAATSAPAAVAVGDAARLWVTTAGALNIADGGSTISIDDGAGAISIDDNAGSITVDAPVATPVFVRLSDGASAITTLPVSIAGSVAVTNAGTFAVQASPISSSNNSPTNATSTSYNSNIVVKASAGTLYMITGFNSKSSAQWIQVHNSTTLPSNATAPTLTFYVPPTSNFSLDFGVYGRYFSTGIVVSNSLAGSSLTIGSSDCWFDVQYK